MAEFEFNCPQCGLTIEADESLRGQVAECPHCEKGIVVPRRAGKSNDAAQHVRENRSASRMSQGFTFKCSHCKQTITVEESARGKLARCLHCGKRVVVPSGKGKSQMMESSSMKTEGQAPVAMGMAINDQTDPKHSASQGYVCTHCGEVTASLKKIHGEILGCFSIIVGIPLIGLLLFLGAFPPIVLIFLAAIFLISGIINLAQGERTKCGKCGKFNTMISVTTPQGRRLLKECRGHPDDNEEQASNSIHDSPEDRLLKLLKLKEMGIVSDGEYEEKRRKILAEI